MFSLLIYSSHEGDNGWAKYSAQCAIELKEVIHKRSKDFIECADENANSRKVTGVLRKKLNENGLILHYGHGLATCLCGYNDRVVIDTSQAHLFKNNICYAYACSSAYVLGYQAVDNGCRAYLGFVGDVQCIPEYIENFKRCASSGIAAMIERRISISEAKKLMIESYTGEIDYLDKLGENGTTMTALMENRDRLTLIGDENARLNL